MSLDKAIKYGKDHRKPYYGAKAVDPNCRNHGGCPYCVNNRMYQKKKEIEKADFSRKEYINEKIFRHK